MTVLLLFKTFPYHKLILLGNQINFFNSLEFLFSVVHSLFIDTATLEASLHVHLYHSSSVRHFGCCLLHLSHYGGRVTMLHFSYYLPTISSILYKSYVAFCKSLQWSNSTQCLPNTQNVCIYVSHAAYMFAQ